MRYRKPSNFSRAERGATEAPPPRELVVLVAHRVFVFTILLLLLLYTRIPICVSVHSTLLQLVVETTLWCCCCGEAARIPTGDLLSQVRGVRVRVCMIVRYPLRCAVAVFISTAIVVRNTTTTAASLQLFYIVRQTALFPQQKKNVKIRVALNIVTSSCYLYKPYSAFGAIFRRYVVSYLLQHYVHRYIQIVRILW